jgi:DNA polymerase elongation subunit (family B)
MPLTLVFDIETTPLDFDTAFDDIQKEYLLRGTDDEEKIEKIKGLGALNPLLGQCITIGLYTIEQKYGAALYTAKEEFEEVTTVDDMRLKYRAFADEASMFRHFWKILEENKFTTFVSFNGRGFDCPFLMLRSAALGIRPTVNLMAGTRWEFKVGTIEHIDLIDKLSFNIGFDRSGAARRFNLDFYTKVFGIKSPKAGGLTGFEVPDFFKAGKVREIAEYCLRDVRATADLYEKWNELLRF